MCAVPKDRDFKPLNQDMDNLVQEELSAVTEPV